MPPCPLLKIAAQKWRGRGQAAAVADNIEGVPSVGVAEAVVGAPPVLEEGGEDREKAAGTDTGGGLLVDTGGGFLGNSTMKWRGSRVSGVVGLASKTSWSRGRFDASCSADVKKEQSLAPGSTLGMWGRNAASSA